MSKKDTPQKRQLVVLSLVNMRTILQDSKAGFENSINSDNLSLQGSKVLSVLQLKIHAQHNFDVLKKILIFSDYHANVLPKIAGSLSLYIIIIIIIVHTWSLEALELFKDYA